MVLQCYTLYVSWVLFISAKTNLEKSRIMASILMERLLIKSNPGMETFKSSHLFFADSPCGGSLPSFLNSYRPVAHGLTPQNETWEDCPAPQLSFSTPKEVTSDPTPSPHIVTRVKRG